MATTRRRRISAHRRQLRADAIRRHESTRAEVERIRRFDDALAKLVLPAAVAVAMLIALVVLVA